jgi:hypothetical protein
MDYSKHFESLMERVAYLYFACKTVGLVILVDLYVFKKPQITLFLIIVAGCYYVNLKLFKWYQRFIKEKESSAL